MTWASSTTRWGVVALVGLSLASHTARADDGEGTDDDNPWLAGPDAPPPSSEEAARSTPPREDGAPPWGLVDPPLVTELPFPTFEHALPEREHPRRFSTQMSKAWLRRYGDFALKDAMSSVAGLTMTEDMAFTAHPTARGLDETHTGMILDGIPLHPGFAFEDFPVLTMVNVDDVEELRFHNGPQIGLGREGAAGGVVEIDTFPTPKELGESLPLVGEARAGMGGADLEKLIAARGDVGFGRVRLGVSASGFHKEDRRLGRGDGIVPASEGWGGTMGARGDILVDAQTRMMAFWRSGRQARTPMPDRCVPDVDGRRVDCLTLNDRALDVLGAGVDVARHIGPVNVDVKSRAHAQRISEEWERAGVRRSNFEQTKDQMWRAGALSSLTLTLPARATGLPITPYVTVGGEASRDRVSSTFSFRSLRFTDAAPDELQPLPQVSPLVDGERTLVKALGTLGARASLGDIALTVDGGAQQLTVQRDDPRLDRGIRSSEFDPFIDAELTGRAQVWTGVDVFMTASRVQRPETLAHRTVGRARMPDGDVPRPLRPDDGAFLEHGVEVGTNVTFAFVDASAVTFASERSGAIKASVDSAATLDEGREVLRWRRGRDRTVMGVEARGTVRTPVDGLVVDGQFGSVVVDEGLNFRTGRLFATRPASGVVQPFATVGGVYAPPNNPFEVFARTRAALPLSRLSSDETQDVELCPVSTVEPAPACFGVPGYALVDVGGRFSPVDFLSLDVVVTNLLDQSNRVRGSTLDGGGIGARASVTLRY